MTIKPILIIISALLAAELTLITYAEESNSSATVIASRRELFTDTELVETIGGQARFQLHAPTRREVAIQHDEPWEGKASGYATIIQDGNVYHMFYRDH